MRSWWWVMVPPETRRAVYRWNKLCNFASCWIYIRVLLRSRTDLWTLNWQHSHLSISLIRQSDFYDTLYWETKRHLILAGVTSLCHWFTHRSGCIILKLYIITSFNCTSPLLSALRYRSRTINHPPDTKSRHTVEFCDSSSCGRADTVSRGAGKPTLPTLKATLLCQKLFH